MAPFRLLTPVLAVIPWEQETDRLLDAEAAQRAGYVDLSGWLGEAEQIWEEHQRSDRGFVENLDYYGKLSAQLPPSPLRVVYAASGTLPAAAILEDQDAVCEHAVYWARAETVEEAR